jgi:hypothetical protein
MYSTTTFHKRIIMLYHTLDSRHHRLQMARQLAQTTLITAYTQIILYHLKHTSARTD